jgi:ketosteroid isomerase-like protein
MIRRSSNSRFGEACVVSALLLSSVSAGCGARPASFETVSSFPEAPRKPPGVAVDPSPSLPAPASSAETFEGLLVLSAPPDPRAARRVVREFFAAVVREAPDKLDELVAAEAWVDSGSQRQPVRAFWRTRFSQLDYGSLADEVLFRESELLTYRPEDLGRLTGTRPTFVDAESTDLVVHARVRASWTGRTRLLGDELFFLLRPRGDRYVIAEIIEDFRLP